LKSGAPGINSHIAQEVTTLAGCLKITRKDGEVFAYTTHDEDLVISNDDSPETFTTYQANGSYVQSASQTDNQMGVPNEEMTGAIMATDITYEELVAGKFNGARIQRFFVNWADLSQGKILLPGYKLGTITPEDNHFRTELRGMVDILRARTGEVAEPVCRVDLFSPECGLEADDFRQSGTVVSTDGKKVMVVSGIANSLSPLVTENIHVGPKAAPWSFAGGINSAYDFGNGSGDAPVANLTALTPGWVLNIGYVDGTVKISDSERPYVDALGQLNDISGDTTGSSGNYFPTHYIEGSQLGKGGLVWSFKDDDDNVISVGAFNPGPSDFTSPTLVFNTGLVNESTRILQPGTVGNTGGGDPSLTVGTYTPGSPATFSVQGFDPFDNAYWYQKWQGHQDIFFVHRTLKVKLPTPADRAACRCIEWEDQKSMSHKIFNMAWQADFAGNKWRTFDKASHSWQDSGITFDASIFDGGAWVELEAIYELTDTTVKHVSLKINGTLHTVNITRAAVSSTDGDYFSTAFQLDEDGNNPPTGYDCLVDNWRSLCYSSATSGSMSTSVIVPDGATHIQFGINDDILSDNIGTGFNLLLQIDKGIAVGTADLTQYNQGGRIEFTSGDNDGYTAEVKFGITSGSPAVDSIVLYLATPLAIQPGDTFFIWPSCDKTPATCLNKYKNILNFRGFKYLPGVDAARVTQLVKLP
jgi:hypothetical protein